MSFIVISSERFAEHQTPPGHPECPERAEVMDVVASEWRRRGGEGVAPREATREQLARVHGGEYLRRIAETAGSAIALDPDTYTSPETYEIALLAAGAGGGGGGGGVGGGPKGGAGGGAGGAAATSGRGRWFARQAITPSTTARWGSAFTTTSLSRRRMRRHLGPGGTPSSTTTSITATVLSTRSSTIAMCSTCRRTSTRITRGPARSTRSASDPAPATRSTCRSTPEP